MLSRTELSSGPKRLYNSALPVNLAGLIEVGPCYLPLKSNMGA